MTTRQFSDSRGSLVWNLVQWIQARQAAKREGRQFSVEYCQLWIDDTRQRIASLNEMERDQNERRGA